MDRDAQKWLGLIFGFLGSMAIANGVLLTSALTGKGFAAEPEAYARAVDWDQTQAVQEASRALGWQVSLNTGPSSSPGQVMLELRVVTRAGTPVTLDRAGLTLVRPADLSLKEVVQLEAIEPGIFRGSASVLASGLWEAQLELMAGAQRFVGTERLELR